MTASVEERDERIIHLHETRKQMEEIVDNFMSTDNEVFKATEAIQAIDEELATLTQMVESGEVFADGAEAERQVADSDGNTFVATEHGYLEPDITSQSCGEGVTPDKGKEPETKKRGSKNKESPSKSEELLTSPGYNSRELPDGTIISVVGQTAPEYGYGRQPDYDGLLRYAKGKGMKESDFKAIYEAQRKILKEDPTGAKLPDKDFESAVYVKAYESIDAAITPSGVEVIKQDPLIEETNLWQDCRRILNEHNVPEKFCKKIYANSIELAGGPKSQANMIKQQMHTQAELLSRAIVHFACTEKDPEKLMTEYASRYRRIADEIDRIKTQAERMIQNEKNLAEMAEEYLNDDHIATVENLIEKSGKKVKYFDTLVARLQLKTYASKFKIIDAARLNMYLKGFSEEALTILGIKRVITHEYDKKALEEKVSDGSPLFPMSAFGTTTPCTKLYIQGVKEK